MRPQFDVVPERSIETRATRRQDEGILGYHWWPNGVRPDGTRLWPDAPQDAYGRSGHNNNHLFVVPAWHRVIVRPGLDQAEDEITAEEKNTFLRMVGAAILKR